MANARGRRNLRWRCRRGRATVVPDKGHNQALRGEAKRASENSYLTRTMGNGDVASLRALLANRGKIFLDSLTLWQINEVIGALGNAGFELIDGNERTTVA